MNSQGNGFYWLASSHDTSSGSPPSSFGVSRGVCIVPASSCEPARTLSNVMPIGNEKKNAAGKAVCAIGAQKTGRHALAAAGHVHAPHHSTTVPTFYYSDTIPVTVRARSPILRVRQVLSYGVHSIFVISGIAAWKQTLWASRDQSVVGGWLRLSVSQPANILLALGPTPTNSTAMKS